MSVALDNKKDVCKFMDDHLVEYSFRGQPQEFLPSSALDKVTRKEVVRRLVAQDKYVVLSNSEELQLVDRIVESGRKLFAICVHCDQNLQHLKVMMDNGITDGRLLYARTTSEVSKRNAISSNPSSATRNSSIRSD
jgi:hypothetical protein